MSDTSGATLNSKQDLFCREYIKDLNATQAAIRAGYSRSTARQQGSDLLSHPVISARIEELKQARMDRVDVDADYVLRRLADEAEADVSDLYGEDGELLPVKEWPLIWRQGLVTQVDVEEIEVDGVKMGVVKKIKVSDRLRRLELIGKHIKVNAFQETVQHKGLEGLAERLARARGRDE